jgi:hypothetical protein
VVVGALSRKLQCNCILMDSRINTLCDEWSKMQIEVIPSGSLSHISVEPALQDQIIMAQLSDKGVQIIKKNLHQKVEKYNCFRQDEKGVLWFKSRLVIPTTTANLCTGGLVRLFTGGSRNRLWCTDCDVKQHHRRSIKNRQ